VGIAAPGRLSSHVVCVAGPTERRVSARRAISAGLLTAAIALALLATNARAVPKVPAGFVVEPVATGLESPTAIAFLPDGRMLVTEQPGRVRIVANGVVRPTPVWAAEDEVLFDQESGLVGIAVDPAYESNHWLYFWYTVDPDSDGVDQPDGGAFGRLARYTMRFDGSDTVDPASRTILLGTSFADAPITGTHTHTVGTLRWGVDGTLLVGHGDGDNWGEIDVGGLYPDVFAPGRADPAMDIGAYRSQSISSMNGKILRIDPATGHGLPSNPFWDGNPSSPRSRVFEYGLRNPFRFNLRPGTGDSDPAHGNPGTLYIGDVGWFRWEELDVADTPGMNFGWPAIEGPLPELEYTAATPFRLGADSVGVAADDPIPPTPPLATWNHGVSNSGFPGGFPGGASVGGVFYTGSRYPAKYRGRWFHGDYGASGGWIRVATVTARNLLVSFDAFGTGMDAPVDLALEPGTQDVIYVSYFTGEVRRIRWTGAAETVTPPISYGRAEPRLGLAPLAVQFRSGGSYDPDGDDVSVHWDFGDGETSDAANPLHTYTAAGVYSASLTVTDTEAGTDRDTFTVVVVEHPVLPTTGLLDDFDRDDGALGAPWITDGPGLSVRDGTLVSGGGEARALWGGAEFSSVQEVWATIGPLAKSASRVALLLKAQGLGATDARVEVSYDPQAGSVLVTTDDLSFGKLARGAPIPVTFASGDRFGARCTATGDVEVFSNGSRIGSRSITGWPAAASGGQVGFWIEAPSGTTAPAKGGERPHTLNLSDTRNDPHPVAPMLTLGGPINGVLDDFGGGDTFIPGDRKPVPNIASPVDSSFFDATGPIALTGRATDSDDPPDSLTYRWTIVRHHTNRTEPPLVFTGAAASFTPIDPAAEAGTWYEVELLVADPRGARDSTLARIFPASDLEPADLRTNAGHIASGTPAELGFWIRNRGPLISTRSFWRVLLDDTSIGTDAVTIAGHDSAYVEIPLPAFAAGPHLLRVVADTLGQCVETDESNDVRLLPFVAGGSVGVDGALPKVLALSNALPNPARGAVRFALDLPQAASVTFEIHDLEGRIVFSAPPRTLAAGRQTLGWDGRAAGGRAAPPGVYLARARVGPRTFVRRIALVR